uniref:Protein NATD1 n=1 Tax=Panagrolaimus sp. JU765 TaxID=591449 RepID=A0AC34Q602_9BILA
MASKPVQHCAKTLKFFIKNNGKDSVLLYSKVSNAALDLFHTEVPPEHRGKGYGAALVKEAFKYAKENNYKVIPSCSYVEKYAREQATPEEKRLVEDYESRI